MSRRLLFILLLVIFVIASSLIFYPDYESPRMVKFLIITQVMFGLSVLIYFVGRRFDLAAKDRSLFYLAIACAILVRIVMIVGAGDNLYLSDDVYRYLWDGKQNVSGINPYLYEPTAPEVEHLVDEDIHPKINHSWLPTIYPPMAQNLFAITHLISGQSIVAFKWLCFLFELLTIATLMVWSRTAQFDRANLLLYLYSPLVIIEFFLSAHLDILALPFLLSAFILVIRKRPVISGLLLALAVLIKFYGLLFFPFIFLNFKGKNRWQFGASFWATIILMYLPYAIGSDGKFLGSLFEYLQSWQSNSSGFLALRWAVGYDIARFGAAGLIVAWFIYQLVRSRGKADLWDCQLFAFGGYIVLTPVLFPWYLVWIVPFLIRNLNIAFLYLSGSILLTYELYIAQYGLAEEAAEILWVRLIVYVPFYLILIYQAFKQRRGVRVEHG